MFDVTQMYVCEFLIVLSVANRKDALSQREQCVCKVEAVQRVFIFFCVLIWLPPFLLSILHIQRHLDFTSYSAIKPI